MSRFWPRRSGNGPRAIASSCSLFLVLLGAFAGAQDYERILRDVEKAVTPEARREILNKAGRTDGELRVGDGNLSEKLEYLRSRASAQRLSRPLSDNPGAAANREQRRGNRSFGSKHVYNPLSVSRDVIL